MSETSEEPYLSNNVNLNNFIGKGSENLPYVTTDMMVNLLANEEKLKNEDERWNFNKDNNSDHYSENNDRHSDHKQSEHKSKQHDNYSDDDIDKYTDKYTDKHSDRHSDKYSEKYSDKTDKTDEVPEVKKTKEQLKLEKLDMLRKLAELKDAGVPISKNYDMDSDYDTMKYEYEMHKSIRAKKNGINWMSSMTLNMIYGIEMLNDKYNPFDLKLTGWSKQINADMNDYYDVFGDLYEKYNKPGKKMAPELKLIFMISGSALRFCLQNALLGNIPSTASYMDSNPDLKEQLTKQAAADTQKNNKNGLNDYVQKQHDLITQQTKDLHFLKQKELEKLNRQKEEAMQQKYNSLQNKLQEQPKFNNPQPNQQYNQQQQPNQQYNQQPNQQQQYMPSNIQHIMTQQYAPFTQQLQQPNIQSQPSMRPPPNMPNMQNSQNMQATKDDIEELKKQQLINQYLLMQQMNKTDSESYASKSTKTSRSSKTSKSSSAPSKSLSKKDDSKYDNISQASSVEINPNIDNIIKQSKSKLEKVELLDHDEVSKSTISFGSKNKKGGGIKITF